MSQAEPRPKSTAPASLPKANAHEWRFDTVPEGELDICLVYEYGREHVKNSKRWRELIKQRQKKFSLELGREIFSIFGKNRLYWFLDPAFVDTPWQSLEKAFRRGDAKEFSEQSQSKGFRESIKLRITLQRDLGDYMPVLRRIQMDFASSGLPNSGWCIEPQPTEPTVFDSWVIHDQDWHSQTNQREYGFFAINWDYTDGELQGEFKKWLAEKRGDRRRIESQKGKVKTRSYLKALGAKRLLDAGYTVAAAMSFTEKVLKDSNGNPIALYDSERGWSKAKNQIVPDTLKRLFAASR